MFCSKCGNQIKDGFEFCPNCGTPAYIEKKESKSENENQGEDTAIKDIQSQLNLPHPLPPNKVKGYVIKKNMLIILGLLIAILPFIITGFSFFFTWYILIAFVVYVVYTEHSNFNNEKTEENSDLINAFLIIFLIISLIMYIWGPLNPNY